MHEPIESVIMTVTKEEASELKKLCQKHKRGETFEFKGSLVLKEYGDYLVMYLESKFGGLE